MYREKPGFIDFSAVTKLSTPTTCFERQKSQKEFRERYYILEQITGLLEQHHYKILAYQQDFIGTPFTETSEAISIIAQKVVI